MRNEVTYEWTVEEVDEFGDANSVHFFDSLADACAIRDAVRGDCHSAAVAVVRHEGNSLDGEVRRFYAYVNDEGRLPEVFSSGRDEADGPPVPARFQAEIDRMGHQGLIPCKAA